MAGACSLAAPPNRSLLTTHLPQNIIHPLRCAVVGAALPRNLLYHLAVIADVTWRRIHDPPYAEQPQRRSPAGNLAAGERNPPAEALAQKESRACLTSIAALLDRMII